MQRIDPPDCPPQNPSYSQAMVSGSTVYVAGQIGIDPTSGALVGDDVASQTERIFQSLEVILAAAGSAFDRIVKVTVYLVDLADWPAMNEVYLRHLGRHAPPKTTVEVRGLALGARVEIDVTAEV